jgi:flavin reductase (DIM6/NTAB) family NADH-FMN oxidoreductase RutF
VEGNSVAKETNICPEQFAGAFGRPAVDLRPVTRSHIQRSQRRFDNRLLGRSAALISNRKLTTELIRKTNYSQRVRFFEDFIAANTDNPQSIQGPNRKATMEYAANDLSSRECYKVLTSFVLPRPIAWVTTIGPTGVVNAAPFSFFNVFCEEPPLCMFAVNLRPDGRVKDTAANIQRNGEFVVNLADEPLARAMHDSSGDFPPEIGEPGYLGLRLAPSTKVPVPRLVDAPWAMECRTWRIIDVNGDRQLIMGEGINFHIRDELWDSASMRVHMDRYHPVGRMFADRYCRTDDRMEFPAAQGASTAR